MVSILASQPVAGRSTPAVSTALQRAAIWDSSDAAAAAAGHQSPGQRTFWQCRASRCGFEPCCALLRASSHLNMALAQWSGKTVGAGALCTAAHAAGFYTTDCTICMHCSSHSRRAEPSHTVELGPPVELSIATICTTALQHDDLHGCRSPEFVL
jgi:hypothetical protein